MLDSIIYLRCQKSLIDGVKEAARGLEITSSEYIRMAINYYLSTYTEIQRKAQAKLGLLHDDIG